MIRLADMVIGAADVQSLASYYEKLANMQRVKEGDGSFVILVDSKTQQRLCIVPDAKRKPCPGMETEDFEGALARIASLGGKVVQKEHYPKMDMADCEDPAGQCFMIWQSK